MIYNTFTASNSYKGFYSLFDQLLNEGLDGQIYLIKGGPGCGKSTFMKKVSEQLENTGYIIEQALCSSDSDSLDGIKTQDNKITIIDATPPHSYDMRYPGAVESIIDLSVFWNKNKLTDNKDSIIALSNEISKRYASVYSLLNIAGILLTSNVNDTNKIIASENVNDYINKHFKQNGIYPINSKPKTLMRFLSAINCKGIVTLNDTINKLCDSALVIEDDTAHVDIIMKKILSYLQKSGYETIVFFNPLSPQKIDHIIIPQIHYGFFTSNKTFNISISDQIKTKKVDSSRFINKSKYDDIKGIYNYKKRTISKILDDATQRLEKIKQLHDELEKYYISAMDYDKMNKYTEQFIEKLF